MRDFLSTAQVNGFSQHLMMVVLQVERGMLSREIVPGHIFHQPQHIYQDYLYRMGIPFNLTPLLQVPLRQALSTRVLCRDSFKLMSRACYQHELPYIIVICKYILFFLKKYILSVQFMSDFHEYKHAIKRNKRVKCSRDFGSLVPFFLKDSFFPNGAIQVTW